MSKKRCRHCGRRIVWYAPISDDDPFGPWWQHKRTNMRHCDYLYTVATPGE